MNERSYAAGAQVGKAYIEVPAQYQGAACDTKSPSPTTVENLLDQKIGKLNGQLHSLVLEIMHVAQLKNTLPMVILHRPACDIRELNQYL